MPDSVPPEGAGPPAPDNEARNHALRFLRNGAVRTVSGLDPNMTVLRYLREVERRTGTKEGCAEGDCGACTVMLGELAEDGDGASDQVRWRAVNACLLLLPVLDGKALVAVEDLKAPDGNLHPVQQALVDEHGSQCGFCTPGIVMSLAALGRTVPRPTRAQIEDALAGNLCRCTGYRPIIAAAERAAEAVDLRTSDDEAAALLRSIRRAGALDLAGEGRRFLAPRSLAELAALRLAYPEAQLLAGGTDLALAITKQHRDLDALIYLGGVPELRTIARADGVLDIGAACPYADAADAIGAAYPDFGRLLRRLGSVQIRNVGTIGGNIANGSPIGDSMPPLIALSAGVRLRRGDEVRELPLDEFYLGYRRTALAPGEFVERIRLPLPDPALRFAVYKLSKRFDQDISAVCAAYALRLDEAGRIGEARLCHGGMAATPQRAARAEAALTGRLFDAAALADAQAALAEDYAPISDMRASARYRVLAAQRLLARFHLETTGGPGIPTRILDFADAANGAETAHG